MRSNRELIRAQERLDATIYRIIAERRAEGRDRGDLLSMLLAAEDADDPRRRLSDSEIRDQAMTLFLAGHETTATALGWTWHLLAQHEPVRARMKTEIDSVLGPDRLPELEDTARLPYVTAVFSESMRLYPPVWVLGRRAKHDVVLGDVEVPARTIVLASQYLMHRDPRFWPDAGAFQPERWLEEKERPKFSYFPFGGGGRICIGDGFAWAEGVIMLAVMARHLRFEAVPGHPIDFNPSVTLRPKHGLKMIAHYA
jgi:cytochrome P450